MAPLTPIDGMGGTKTLYTADDLEDLEYEEQIDGTKQIDSSDTSPLSEFWNDDFSRIT